MRRSSLVLTAHLEAASFPCLHSLCSFVTALPVTMRTFRLESLLPAYRWVL